MQKSHIQGWWIVCDDYAKAHGHIKNDIAKTHAHIKNEMSKSHGLAIVKVSRYLKGDNI